MIASNLEAIRQRITAAAERVGRAPGSVRLVAVSKGQDLEAIEAAAACGQAIFGENYLQESRGKISARPDLAWHFIGSIQSNKTSIIAELFHLVETLDRIKVAQSLDRHLAGLGKVMPVLMQVNIGRESKKGGVDPEQAAEFARALKGCPRLRLLGLMAIPPACDDPEQARPYFRRMKALADALATEGVFHGTGLPELSMGMSGDFEVAIEEGATLVRVGTALFGARRKMSAVVGEKIL